MCTWPHIKPQETKEKKESKITESYLEKKGYIKKLFLQFPSDSHLPFRLGEVLLELLRYRSVDVAITFSTSNPVKKFKNIHMSFTKEVL